MNLVYQCLSLFILIIQINISRPCIEEPKKESVITYDVTGGRLGDHLLAYAKAKYIALKFNIPLLHNPFELSDQLVLDDIEEPYSKEQEYQKTKKISSIPKYITHDNVLYILTDKHWHGFNKTQEWYGLPYDPGFFRVLKKYIRPKIKIPKIERSPNAVTIAIHVRTGGDYEDDKQEILKDKGKFPSKSYYITQLKIIGSLFSKKIIDVHIFTDESNPEYIIEMFREAFPDERYNWWCRMENNSHDCNVIEDLFMMAQCECLIRPRSCYSAIAQIIGNHKIISYTADTEEAHMLVRIKNRMIRANNKNIYYLVHKEQELLCKP